MACFIVPGAEAVVTTVITKIVENKEHKKNKENEQKNDLLSYNNAIDTEKQLIILTGFHFLRS